MALPETTAPEWFEFQSENTPLLGEIVEAKGHFAFAGLWTSRRDPETEELVESCTIITTQPNALVAPVHDRMPVILPLSAEGEWLDPELSREHTLSLLQPLEAALMRATPASRLVNSVRNEGPELLEADEPLRLAS